MRNKIASLALLFILSFTLTACTIQDLPVIGKFFGGSSGSISGSITVWGLWENPDVMASIIAKYKELHPNVTINYEDRSVLKTLEYRDRIFARAGEDVGADVLLVHNSWLYKLKDNFSPMPAKLMDAKTYSTTFYPVATQSAVFDSKIYGVPFYYDGLVLLYNKDHFLEIGQDDPPTSWAEFESLAKNLRYPKDGSALVRAGAAMGTADNNEHFSDILGLLFAQTDVAIPNDLETKAAADALDYYVSFVKRDMAWDNLMPEANTAFIQGKVSMIIVPTWRILDILKANPNLNFGVAPVPQALPEKPATWATFWMWSVPSSSKNQALAWDFVNFMTSEKQELSLFSDASKVRPFGVPFARVSLAQQLANNLYLSPAVATAPYAKSAELAARSGNNKVTDALRDAVNAVLEDRVDALTALKNFRSGTPQPTD
ncbi:MAG: Extracellular solute-binding protein, family 1 [uncultured bacterium]|nr:MAG: Extracellular solute-binding protein, family 1 [uncultured bacterium]